ncbi:MAG: IS200/IS605 family transposase [Acidobacteria bacterium]|nr:IS200/IS605 family transposase [Acidobacteriota bacterium]MBI3658275.1 IS200/IS605 family transposase [Acidobacteriota bacterium]
MASTHLSLHYHLIFSTKERFPFIDKSWRNRLHAYLGGVVRDLGGIPDEINGIADHVHLLIGLKATHCLADVLREIKKSSSEWVHKEIGQSKFSWQVGYAAYTVSPSQVPGVREYIGRQELHHRKKTFQYLYC